jgi:hypothetical protein
MGRGPDLSKVGADPKHTADWFKEQIRTPEKHRTDKPDKGGPAGGVPMPPFDEKKVNEEDLKALIDYLSSLK